MSTRCQKWLCMVVILCSSGAGAASGTLLDGDADVLYVLGAQLVRDFSTGAIVPAVPGEARASAAALLSNRSSARGPQRAVAVTGGGYLIGVSYEIVNNTILDPANNSVAAFVAARDLVSEAFALRSTMTTLGVPVSSILVEEGSATTVENAVLGSTLLSRLARDSFNGTTLSVCLVTNWFHMPWALADFKTYTTQTMTPCYAEDWVALLGCNREGVDWIDAIAQMYV